MIQERKQEARRKKSLRLDHFLKYRESFSQMINKNIKNRIDDDNHYENALILSYLKNRKIEPDIVCVYCDNSFFPKSVQKFQRSTIKWKLRDEIRNADKFIKNLKNNSSESIGKTCTKYVTSGKLQKMTTNSDLKFPALPEIIRNLTAVEERTVSPYVPFMQMKSLQPHAINSQLSLKGSIVNIPVEINDIINVSPRRFDSMPTILIKLKRHLDYKSDYMYERIRPPKVCEALGYLWTTPLYIQNKVDIDPEFFELILNWTSLLTIEISKMIVEISKLVQSQNRITMNRIQKNQIFLNRMTEFLFSIETKKYVQMFKLSHLGRTIFRFQGI